MNRRPKVVAFDIMETLFSLEPQRRHLVALGLPSGALELWFARALRDAFALGSTGSYRVFDVIARGALDVILAESGLASDRAMIDIFMGGFRGLPAHPDVAPAFAVLETQGLRIVTLTNGSADTTRHLLRRANLDAVVERVVSVDEVQRWKPAREVYLHAATMAAVEPDELALISAHAWDVHGASQAGLMTGWVSRLERTFQPAMNPSDVTGASLLQVVQALLALPCR